LGVKEHELAHLAGDLDILAGGDDHGGERRVDGADDRVPAPVSWPGSMTTPRWARRAPGGAHLRCVFADAAGEYQRVEAAARRTYDVAFC